MHQAIARRVECGHHVRLAALELVAQQLSRTGGGSDTTRRAGRAARRSRSSARAARACRADPVVWSTESHRPPHMRSSTEVCLRNRASAGGSRDRSSRRKYSDTNRSSPSKPAAPAGLSAPRPASTAPRGTSRRASPPCARSVRRARSASSSTPAASSSSSASRSSSRRSPRRSRAPIRAPASGRAAVPAPRGSRSRSASRPGRTRTAPRARPDRRGWRPRADRRAPAPAGRSAPPARSRGAGRVSTRPIPPGPTTRRTPRARAARRGESRPRCSAGTPRRRRLGRRARPTRTDADQPRPNCASSVVLPYPAGATTVTRGTREAHSRATTSPFATVPGRVKGASELDLREVEWSLCDDHWKASLRPCLMR